MKDRAALAMVEAADVCGEPFQGGAIVGLAMIAAQRGHRAVVVAPATRAVRRRRRARPIPVRPGRRLAGAVPVDGRITGVMARTDSDSL